MVEQGVEVTELPSGTVTFLLIDIEGNGGSFVKTTGDGAHAVFATASDGIDAAVAAQVAIGTEEWPRPCRFEPAGRGPAE